jgi:uncharacterized protein (TIGR00266 family)
MVDSEGQNTRGEFRVQYTIQGSTLQSLHITLNPGETVFSETGCLLSMTPNVELNTNFQGGLGGIFKRMITGNSIALNYFTATSGMGEVTFTTRLPGHIVAFEIAPHRPIYVQRHSFVCATSDVNLDVAATFNLYGFFGGNGLVINKLAGYGTAFASIDGEIIEKDLAPGESILIHPGHLAAYEETVSVDVQRMRGFKNMFFGGDGFALVRAVGPGKVWLHSLSIHNLVELLRHHGLAGTVENVATNPLGAIMDIVD